MRTKILIPILTALFLPILSCGKIYSTTPFSDAAWPTATISRVDYQWPGHHSDLPPSVAISDISKDGNLHTYFLVEINAFRLNDKAPGIFVHLGASAQELTMDDQPFPKDTFAFVSRFPANSPTVWFLRAQPDDPYCETTRSSIVFPDNESAERMLVQEVLALGTKVANHFQMYPNYEQPFPEELRQQIQQLLQNLPFPERWKSNGC